MERRECFVAGAAEAAGEKKILSNFLRQNEKTENYNTSKKKINKLKCEIIFIFDIVFF